MVELTIQHNWGKWFVRNKHADNQDVCIPCDTPEEAWAVFEQLNGSPLEVITDFYAVRQKLKR